MDRKGMRFWIDDTIDEDDGSVTLIVRSPSFADEMDENNPHNRPFAGSTFEVSVDADKLDDFNRARDIVDPGHLDPTRYCSLFDNMVALKKLKEL